MADDLRADRPHADVWDLLPGYALDALDDAERRAVDRLLASDADARRALDEYRDVVASFVVEAEPPAALRASVLDRVRSTPQVPGPDVADVAETGTAVPAATPPAATPPAASSPVAEPPSEGAGAVVDLADRRRRRRWATAVAAVAAAAAIAVPTTIAVQVSAERDRLREQAQAVSEMLADPDSSILRGAVEGGGEATVLVADDDMFFQAEGLPEPGQGRAYQLWVVAGDGSVSSAGVLALRDGTASSLVQDSDGVGMAVSVEPAAGSEQPTTTPVVVLGT
ncbi:anti-sigma factor domain-containing protein [Promicromonospora sp. NPDC052451]|uniref:anti-sigma factor domain-containing protein n=1 Tax=Promicromonospora sp. NPDC052451 TaxID=3364407 RepID=UPI0037CC167E